MVDSGRLFRGASGLSIGTMNPSLSTLAFYFCMAVVAFATICFLQDRHAAAGAKKRHRRVGLGWLTLD